MATMDYAEIHVDQKYHRHIIGKGGASGEYTAGPCIHVMKSLEHLFYSHTSTDSLIIHSMG